MKTTRLVSLLVAILFCCGMCVSSVLAEDEQPEEYRITLYVETTNVASTEDTIIGQIVKDKFNIVFDFEVMTGDWNEFINLKLASGDYPELAYLRWDYVGGNWVNGGGAIEMDSFFADKENFQYLHKDRLPLWRMEDPSGNNRLMKYTVNGGLSEDIGARCDMLVRCDVLKAMGYPKLLSASSWVDFLEEAVKLFPTDIEGNPTIGLSTPLAESWGPAMMNIFAEKAGSSGATLAPICYNFVTGKFDDYITIPAVKENYEFFNTLYRKGLLDNEVFILTGTELGAKMNTAQPIAIFYPTWLASTANINLANNGHEECSYIAMPIQADSQVENGEYRYLATWQGYGTYAYTMTPKTRYPERIAELIDWACSEEGLSLLNWGIEGTHWTWVDGVKTPTEEFVQMYLDGGDEYYQQGIGIWDFLSTPGGYSPYDEAPVRFSDASVFTKRTYNDTVKETLAAYGFELEQDFWVTGEYVKSKKENITVQQSACVLDPDSEAARINEQIVQTRNNYIADLVRAEDDEEFESVWTSFVKAHNDLKPQIVIDYVNARLVELEKQYAEAMT